MHISIEGVVCDASHIPNVIPCRSINGDEISLTAIHPL